jgi:hypothetical protein
MNETLSKNIHRIMLGNCLHYQHDERSAVLGHPRVLLRYALGQLHSLSKWTSLFRGIGAQDG